SLGDLRPALGVTDRVHLEPVAAQTELPEEARGEIDDLDIGCGLLGSETLQAPLPELAVAKKLRALPAEHRVGVKEPNGPRRAVQSVFEVRAGHGGRPPRAEGKPTLAMQRDVVHLVAHDVAGLADAFYEDSTIFDDGCHDPRIAVT